MKLPVLKLLFAAAFGTMAGSSHAEFPERPVKLIVAFAAGTSTDALARELANALSVSWKQPVVVDNRAGAEGNIGAKAVASAEGDGYTALMTSSSSAVLDGLMRKTPLFDPLKGVAPLCSVGSVGLALYVNSGLPFKNLADFIAAAKAQPGKYTFGYASATGRLAAELFQQQAGVKLKGIPYKVTAGALTAVASGEIDIVINDPNGAAPLYQSGKINPLVVTASKRMKLLPDVPIGAEAGLPGFEMVAWFGTFLPPNTPAPLAESIRHNVAKALSSPSFTAARNRMGVDEFTLCGDTLAKFQASDIVRWRKVIEQSAIPIE